MVDAAAPHARSTIRGGAYGAFAAGGKAAISKAEAARESKSGRPQGEVIRSQPSADPAARFLTLPFASDRP
ncbi:MAG: hypothetical protein K0S70_688 [Microbacterium sp.]|jgi:hypothetical protein|nr:hypothetical protein [Microbacterium sp.]